MRNSRALAETDTQRLEAFSDGIFAIAITLLILEIKVPQVNPSSGTTSLAPELVLTLGGPIGAYEEQDYPFLLDELRLLEQRLVADLPTLGICLGSQLMARVLGAEVYPGSCKEIGWAPIERL